MTYEILILDNFQWSDISGKLYFSRYFDNNPALILKNFDEMPIITITVNIPEFFHEYPFGDNKLVAIKDSGENQGIVDSLTDAAVLEPVFTLKNEYEDEEIRICELSESVVDLLKSYGEYYV